MSPEHATRTKEYRASSAGNHPESQWPPALITLGLALILALPLTGHSSGQKIALANQRELVNTPDTSRNVVESVSGRKFAAEFVTLTVPENRRRTDSRVIQVPVVRVKATHPLAREPVFYLFGGPGASNSDVDRHQLLDWFYEDFDAVYVGYRGVDGTVALNCPELRGSLRVRSPLRNENLLRRGKRLRACFERLSQQGVDLTSYTILDVCDDIEAARKELGYGKINIWAHSWGTTVAYVYALRYPQSVNRLLLLGASSPPRVALREPAIVDEQLRYYARLWTNDPVARDRTADLVGTIGAVLKALPRDWQGSRIDRDRVRIGFFDMLANRDTAAQAFDAFVRAQKGDWRGLAAISNEAERDEPDNFGDAVLKLASYAFDARRNYAREMDPPDSIIGSPDGELIWATFAYSHWPIEVVPERWRQGTTPVQTLLLHGTVDFSSPPEYAQNELPVRFPNGRLVMLRELGHNDIIVNQVEAFRRLMEAFFARGEVDTTLFHEAPMIFQVSKELH
jgi:pimeloyl-ACP methyl ester carboxylesterase